MISKASQPLGGEGCPAPLLAKPLGNRNIYAGWRNGPLQVRTGLSGTGQERTGCASTPQTQETGFLFRKGSDVTDRPRRYRLISPDGKPHEHLFDQAHEAVFTAKRLWPGVQQREDDTPGWDIEVIPATD